MYACSKLPLYAHIAPAPRIFLRPNDLQGIVGEMHELFCVVALSSTIDTAAVQLQWDFISNDNRITVLPAAVIADDSIGNIYSTVIQFAYLVEEDEGNYTCTLTVENPVMSNFDLEILSKHLTIAIPVNGDSALETGFYVHRMHLSYYIHVYSISFL